MFRMILALLLTTCAIVQGARAQSTQPTAEQRAFIESYNNADPTTPAVKLDISPFKADGTPNEAFGRPAAGFLRWHERFLKEKTEQPIDLLFIGDSITEGWRTKGKKIWDERYAKLNAANFGVSGDRTQHVLWRIENGELDGIKPKVVVLLIGVNNGNLPSDKIAAGVKAVAMKIREKLPAAKLLLLGVFPWGESPVQKNGQPTPARAKLSAVNAELAKLDDGKMIRFLSIWDQFLNPDGTISRDVMYDFKHPDEKGYQIWADAMQPLLDELMK